MNAEDAARFLAYDYTETKDLLKSFLTLASGTLVFSVTFSEKIVGFHQATRQVRLVSVLSWSAFALAISSGGLSMTSIAAAAGKALYGESSFPSFICTMDLAYLSWALILIAGISYILGLILLIIAAASRMNSA